jgi:hypothetical protein
MGGGFRGLPTSRRAHLVSRRDEKVAVERLDVHLVSRNDEMVQHSRNDEMVQHSGHASGVWQIEGEAQHSGWVGAVQGMNGMEN